MAEPIAEYGNEVGLCGHDGSVWIKVKVDADGHLQVDGVSVALPTDAATATNQATMITALQLIDDLRNALGSVNTDDLQVDVKTSALPTDAATATNQATLLTELQAKLETADLNLDGTKDLQVDVKTAPLPTDAATATNQTTMITALQLIDDLRNALGSVNTDDLQVDVKTMPTTTVQTGGGDKPFSLESVVADRNSNLNPGAGEVELDSDAVPSAKVWVITNISAVDNTSNTTSVALFVVHDAVYVDVQKFLNPTAAESKVWTGQVFLDASDYIAAIWTGVTAGDDLYLSICGYQMDAP